jgi:tripartite-type tricarboxylate transporter receptor subunit TctC
MMRLRVHYILSALMAATMASAVPAFAQGGAGDVTKIIVPFSPGGANDVFARVIAEQLSSSGVRQSIVMNRPGGSATIGMNEVAQAKPDGKTLGVANVSFSVNPSLMKSLPYDTEKDFVPVALIATVPFVLTVHPDVKARSIQELVARLKKDPEKYGYSSSGFGSGSHLATELFLNVTGTKMIHAPYKGGSEHVVASLNGETGVMFSSLPSSIAFVKSGQLIPLAITSKARDSRLPDVITFAEAGVPDYTMTEWTAIVAPKGTPPDVVQAINKDIREALQKPEVQKRIEAVGGTVAVATPEEVGQHIKAEMAKWKHLVAANKLEAQ